MKSVFYASVLATLALAATGCVKFKQAWTINPDGSGKMVMTFGVSQQILAMAGDQDPFEGLDDPAEMIDQEDNGWVAFTKPVIVTEGDYKFATFTGYFEDINEVTFSGDGGNGGDMEESSYSLDDGTFTVSNGMLGQVVKSMAEDPQMQDPQMKAMMAPMMTGFEMSESYDLPGQVTDAEGFTVDGQVASTALTAEDMLGDTPPTIAGLDDNALTVQFDPAGWEGGQAAWDAELASAKAEWETIKQGTAVGAGAE